jgi:phosphoglycolate phosphatase-like HAD superfamily hydrolase
MTEHRAAGAVLFDLDGTLVDTAPDLARAVNTLREEHGLAALPYARIRCKVSHGGTALTRLALDIEPGAAGFDAKRERLLALYSADLATHSRLFPGMDEVLEELEARGCPWGIVTNKPAWLTDPLVRNLDLAALAGHEPRNCLYVGDAERDVTAGRAAGMVTLIAAYGYLGSDDRPESWGADGVIDEPAGLLAWLPAGARRVVTS